MDRQLFEDIKKNKLHPVYFFYGAETFLIDETVHWIRKQLMPEEDEFGNEVWLDLEETSIQELVQEAETPPFFGERRLIIGKNAYFLTSAKRKSSIDHQVQVLVDYLGEPFTSNIVILIAPSDKLDKRKKIVKQLQKQARTIQFEPLQGNELSQWVQKRCHQLEVKITSEAVGELIQLVGNDLRLLQQECVKLATFVGQQGTINPNHVAELVPRTLEQDVFKLTDRIARRQMEEAFSIWYDLLYQKEEPIRILALITRQFRLMLQVKVLSQQGYPEKEIASQLKVHPYPVKLALKQVTHFSEKMLRSLLAQALQADQDIKSGRVDKILAVERLLLHMNIPV